MSVHIKREGEDWSSRRGRLGFKGVEYNLPLLEIEDLKILEQQVKEDKSLLEEIIKREDLEELGEGWQREVGIKISVRKRQLMAIVADFLRRKKEERPLESFAFQSVHKLLGPEVLAQVKELAKELKAKHRARMQTELHSLSKEEREAVKEMGQEPPTESVLGMDGTLYPPQIKEKMCGDKVKHVDRASANGQIESMKARGKNTRAVNVYGPCPFCGFYHVGHKPKGAIWHRE